MLDTKYCLKAANQALIAAERELLPRFKHEHPGKWRYKKHSEILTEADEAANHAIIKTLKKLTPDFGIITEESPRLNGPKDIRWIVDPLDGTTNYTAHLPIWGISLALVAGDDIFLGAISLPTMNERYFAIAGQGAWSRMLWANTPSKSRTRTRSRILSACFVTATCRKRKSADSSMYRH